MGENKGDFEKYDHSKEISNQIGRIDKLITEGPSNSEFDSFEQYFYQVVMGLMTLDGLLEPFKDEDYGKSEDSEGPLDDFSMPNSVPAKLEFVRDTFREITLLLKREELFYVRKNGRRNL